MRSFRRVFNGLAAAGLALLIVSPSAEASAQNTRNKTRRRAAVPPRATSTPPAGQTQANPAVFIGGGAATGAVRQDTTGTRPGGNNSIIAGGAGVGAAHQPTGTATGASAPAAPSAEGSNIGPKKGSNAIGAGGAGLYLRNKARQPTTTRRRVRRGRN